MAGQNRVFYDYVEGGRNRIQQWLDAQTLQVDAELGVKLEYLRRADKLGLPETDTIKGKKYAGLFEIRFRVERTQYRVLACHAKFEHHAIILLAGATHKQRVYDPPSVFDTALKRMTLSRDDKGLVIEREI